MRNFLLPCLAVSSLSKDRRESFPIFLLIGALIPSCGLHSLLWPNYFPKASSSKTISDGVGASTYEFRRGHNFVHCTIRGRKSTSRYISPQLKIYYNRYLYVNVHSSIIHSSWKMEATQIPINKWMRKQKVVYPHNIYPWKGRRFWHMQQHGWNLKQAKWNKPVKYCMTPQGIHSRQIYRHGKYIRSYQGLG